MSIVRAYHNVTTDADGRPLGMLDGYSETHQLSPVFETTMPDSMTDLAVCEDVYRLLNVGNDPDFTNPPDPRALEYRFRRNRSLSEGDVVQVDGAFYACRAVGFQRIANPDHIGELSVYGTNPLPRKQRETFTETYFDPNLMKDS